jgi:hypothetical protein
MEDTFHAYHNLSISSWLRRRLLISIPSQHSGKLTEKLVMEKVSKVDSSRRAQELRERAIERRLMGYFRYEVPDEQGNSYEERVKLGEAKPYYVRMMAKLKEYERTGNLELIVDCYNYVLLEWYYMSHPLAHFESTERQDHEVR